MKWYKPGPLLLLVLVLTADVQTALPWWSLAVVTFLIGLTVARTAKLAFWAGFGGAALSWLLHAAWLAYQNDGLLAHRLAQLLPLGGSAAALVAVAGLVAGLAGGLAGLAGAWARAALWPLASEASA